MLRCVLLFSSCSGACLFVWVRPDGWGGKQGPTISDGSGQLECRTVDNWMDGRKERRGGVKASRCGRGWGSRRRGVGARTNTINPTTVAWTASEGGFCSRTNSRTKSSFLVSFNCSIGQGVDDTSLTRTGCHGWELT